MSDQLLTVLKFALLALLYLFFLRVVRAVWAELKEPRPAAVAAPGVRAAPGGRGAPAAAIPGAMPASAAPATVVTSVAAAGKPIQQLVIIEPADAKGRAFPLDAVAGRELTVGRGGGCGVALADDTFVSQLHARLFHADGGWFVEDLGSTNGTFLNRQKVSGPQPLRKGDRLQVGRTVLEVAG